MTTQTKCTIALGCLFIVEILPLPFTAMISLYVVRRRPKWFPGVVQGLYQDIPGEPDFVVEDGGKATRRKCTMTLTTMFLVDLIIPVTIPFGLYIVRRRPMWFKNVANRLYAPEPSEQDELAEGEVAEPEISIEDTPEFIEAQKQKHMQIEKTNLDFARSIVERG